MKQRYFFNIFSAAGQHIDNVGSLHPDLDSVRQEALDVSEELFEIDMLNDGDSSVWTLDVTDASGDMVFTVTIQSTLSTL